MTEAHLVIPWWNLFCQFLNFTIFFGGLFWLLRKTIKSHFSNRAESYRELVDRAEKAKEEAERSHHLMKERLARLEQDAQQGAQQARSEAEELRSRMIHEAKELAQKLEQEAHRTAMVELEKAKAELERELLEKSVAASQGYLKSLGSNEQKKLQNEFVEKIQVVSG